MAALVAALVHHPRPRPSPPPVLAPSSRGVGRRRGRAAAHLRVKDPPRPVAAPAAAGVDASVARSVDDPGANAGAAAAAAAPDGDGAAAAGASRAAFPKTAAPAVAAVQRVCAAYDRALKKNPVATKAITSCVGFAVGDILAQLVASGSFDAFRSV